MTRQPINNRTLETIEAYISRPGQAVGLIGQKWLNKGLIATYLAEKLLGISEGQLDSHPYVLRIADTDVSSIGIDEVRAISEFLILKVPTTAEINRVVIIERAERLTLEAQNALLKNLEEPPKGTIFILTAESMNSMLPTINSRLTTVNVHKPAKLELNRYYEELGHSIEDIKQAQLISDGLPGLMDQLLSNQENPINEALTSARSLLSSNTFERLSSINDLAKDKTKLSNIFFVIKQMSKIGITSNDPKSANRWRRILSATLDSEAKLKTNSQAKLLLTDYILHIA